MTDNEKIDVGEIDGYVWVRVKGKGSFLTSPPLKAYVERRLDAGGSKFVVDLGDCPAMDSTFMGTLAGIAMRLARLSGDRLQLFGVCDRNRQSLEDLGLDSLIDLNPTEPEWDAKIGEIRDSLEPLPVETDPSDATHVLEAHRRLCEASEENVEKFATVLDVLERQAVND